MKTYKFSSQTLPLVLALIATLIYQSSSGLAQGTAFTYQGRLNDGVNPANGIYDLRFTLHNAANGGAQQGGSLTNVATAVGNGLFTVSLDFGGQFPGEARWLEIGLRTNGGGAFTSLAPRQKLTAAPYAVTAANLAMGVSPAFTGTPAFNAPSGAPFTVLNSTKVTNLNGDLLDGLDSTSFARLATAQSFTGSNVFLGGLGVRDIPANSGSLRVGAPVAGADDKMIWFGDGQFVGVGERVQDDQLHLRGNTIIATRANLTAPFLGIGVTNPVVPLHVAGAIKADSLAENSVQATNVNA